MNDNELTPLPRIQVPRIEADVDLRDINVLASWCERIATEYARANVAPLRAENERLRAEVEHVRAVLREQRQRDEALLRQAFDALFWTTGSDDFSEGGLAREGAIKILFPTIAAIHERLKEEQTMTDRD